VDIQARLKAMEEWLELRTRCPWPEQQQYEILRSVVLFGHSPAESFFATLECELLARGLLDAWRGARSALRLHRALLQSPPPPVGAGVPCPGNLRKEVHSTTNGRLAISCPPKRGNSRQGRRRYLNREG